jgi:hypothetical protein
MFSSKIPYPSGNTGIDPVPIAQQIQNLGIDIICVGVPGLNGEGKTVTDGDHTCEWTGLLTPVEIAQLTALSGNPKNVFVLNDANQLLANFDSLNVILSMLNPGAKPGACFSPPPAKGRVHIELIIYEIVAAK